MRRLLAGSEGEDGPYKNSHLTRSQDEQQQKTAAAIQQLIADRKRNGCAAAASEDADEDAEMRPVEATAESEDEDDKFTLEMDPNGVCSGSCLILFGCY